MPLFWKPYKSDATQFIDSLKQRTFSFRLPLFSRSAPPRS